MKFNIFVKLSIALIIISSVVIYFKRSNQEKPDKILNISKIDDSTKTLVEKINDRASKFKSLSATGKLVLTKQEETHKLSSSIYYESPNKFRLIINSILRKELDIGTDGVIYWFWFGRKDKTKIYYGKCDDPKLNIPFNPIWLANCLSVKPIEVDAVIKKEDVLLVKNGKILQVTKIKNELPSGWYLYEKDTCIAQCEIIEWDNDLPKKLRMCWFKDNIQVTITISNYSKDSIPNSKWEMPTEYEKILIK